MIYKHKHSKDCDIQETVPNLHIDLEKAVETHTIRDTGVIPEFNGIESTDNVGPVIRDTFTAIDAKDAITAQLNAQAQQSSQTQSTETSQPDEGA